MRSRGLMMGIAVLLALGATAAVFMYVNGVRHDARTTGGMVTVVVATHDIPAGTRLDELVANGGFTTEQIPSGAVVRGAVTSLDQLRGKQTSAPIIADEQVSTARLAGSVELGGGLLGIPDGYEAVSIPLDASRVAGGAVVQGDEVTIYATFDATAANVKETALSGTTVTLVPQVQVLRVDSPDASTTTSTQSTTVITLALRPQDAAKVVFAQEKGSVWLGLLPPGQKGVSVAPIAFPQVTK